ncbi:MAG: hypothetical protein KC414_14070, partial [Romboutsia sp.]|nr:hypothetical protein [Romboutsia sp.]
YKIGHETMDEDGTANWSYAIADEVCFEWIKFPRSDFEFETIIHCVRDPFKAIPSIVYTETCCTPNPDNWGWNNVYKSTEYRFRHLNIDFKDYIVNQAIRSFLGWNELIEKMNPNLTVRVEHPLDDIKGKYDIPLNFELPSRTTNSTSHNSLTQDQWNKVDKDLLDKLEEFCIKHNYLSIKDRIKQ